MRRMVWLLAWLFACHDEREPVRVTAPLGGLTVAVEDRPPRIVVSAPDGTVLLDGIPGGIAVATADTEVTHQFGSFAFEERDRVTTAIAQLGDLAADGETISFTLQADRGDPVGTGAITTAPGGELSIRLSAPGYDHVSLAHGCAADEHFLGLGGHTFDVDHRGERVPLWVQEDGIGKLDAPDDDFGGVWFLNGRRHSTHTPMPMLISSRGYSAILDTAYRSVFDLCSTDGGAVAIETSSSDLAMHVWASPTLADAVSDMTGFTGRPRLPPPFTFAPWLDAMHGSANVRRVADALRAHDVPASVIWTEDWRGGTARGDDYILDEDWELDRGLYPDFEEVARDLRARGFAFLTYQNSFLTSTVGTYAEAVAGGHTIRAADGAPYLFTSAKFVDASLLDLSSPAAVAWAKAKYQEALTAGADGYMADFAEWLPTDAVLASGASALERHNLYPVDWQRLHQELFDAQGDGRQRLYFVRSAYLRSQPLVSVVWAGDQQTDFSAGDGLPSVIPMGLGLGLTGFPFYGSDIGGYSSQGTTPTSEELWYRWVTVGALSPVMRTHHGRRAAANFHWERDAAATAHMARWARLHLRLFPYLYMCADEATRTGAPLMRPLAYDHPDFAPGWTSIDTYMLGPSLLVAPVLVEGAASRRVALPPGVFYPLLGGGPVEGEIVATATKEDIPVFVPAGALLVLLPDDVDTLVEVDAAVLPGVRDLDDAGDDRELWLWPGGAASAVEVGGLAYRWDGAALSGAPTTATFAGQPVAIESDAGDAIVVVRGPGTLVLDGRAALTIDGGAADRRVVVRVRGWPGAR